MGLMEPLEDDAELTLADQFETESLRRFLRQNHHLAVNTAAGYYEEIRQLKRAIANLKTQLILAEIRSCEKQINAVRSHQNAWATLLLCVRSGVMVTGFNRLDAATCKAKILDMEQEAQEILKRASWQASRIGCVVRTGIGENGQVFIRLATPEKTSGGCAQTPREDA